MDQIEKSLEELESLCNAQKPDKAFASAIELLLSIDQQVGRLDKVTWTPSPLAASDDEKIKEFCTRFAGALTSILLDKNFAPSRVDVELFLQFKRWLELVYDLSGYRSTDFIASHVIARAGGAGRLSGQELTTLICALTLSSHFDINIDELYESDAALAIVLALSLLGTRYCFRTTAMDRREKLLEWLQGHGKQVQLGRSALAFIAESYMHCSYGYTPHKHAVKSKLIQYSRTAALGAGAQEFKGRYCAARKQKPTIIVTAEYFSVGHAVYRTHSAAVRSLKKRFRVVGLCAASHVSSGNQDCFDEVISIPETHWQDGIAALSRKLLAKNPVAIFHLGVGMSPWIIALASLRLAPVQATSFGHTATTMSPAIDFMILPKEFIGSESVYSERLIQVEWDAIPYTMRDDVNYKDIASSAKRQPDEVCIAVPATVMKLNPRFLDAIVAMTRRVNSKIKIIFLCGYSAGLSHLALKEAVDRLGIPAVVQPNLPYDEYCARLAEADFFLSPFPYGNMNTIVEAAALGLPGICLDGPEAHAHGDVAFFRRFCFPETCITTTVADYIETGIRMIDDAAYRKTCQEAVRMIDVRERLKPVDEADFSAVIMKLVEEYL